MDDPAGWKIKVLSGRVGNPFLDKLYHFAKVAQLVEHDLTKVRVAGSNPVFRSKSRVAQW